jgi:deoxyribonuclease-4
MLHIGRHVSIAGSIDLSFDRALELGCNAMQIFVTNPRGWKLSYLGNDAVSRFRSKAAAATVRAVAHMPYLPNLASSDKAMRSKSVASLVQNLERCDALGIGYLVAHMGSHMGHGKESGLENITNSINEALGIRSKCMLLIENEAGHANSLGDDLRDMTAVADAVGGGRLGFCLDTCHLFAAGYDIRSQKALDRTFEQVDIGKVHAIHLNDAKMGLGSRRDRHANIGFGHIGREGMRSFLSYPGIISKTLLLETPLGPEISEKDEITLVRSLAAGQTDS